MIGRPSSVDEDDRIPLVDLRASYHSHQKELDAAVSACLERASFIGGEDHTAFAGEFSDWCGGGAVALVGNGTDALTLALIEVLGQGDGSGEVITVSNTFIGTTEAITGAGYRPVFVDIDPDTCLMNIDLARAAVNERSRAIVPVHLYGQMVPMDQVMDLASIRGMAVIEDAAQAHGATWQGKNPGALGDAACFSFYPGKNLGAWGDGGAVFTRDKDLAMRISMRANHGRLDKYHHALEGVNSRLDGIQAAVLRVKLRYIDEWNRARREISSWYKELLAGQGGIQLPVTATDAESVYHLYVVQMEDRDIVCKKMHDKGIGVGIHYPIPLHLQPAYAGLGYRSGDFPQTEAVMSRVLSLPVFPEMRRDQVERVARALIESIEK